MIDYERLYKRAKEYAEQQVKNMYPDPTSVEAQKKLHELWESEYRKLTAPIMYNF